METYEAISSRSDALERVHRAITAIQDGQMVIMTDDEDRENEGDLVFAADHVSAEKINFMTKHARGLVCLTMGEKDVSRLKLPMMAISGRRATRMNTAFTVSIEAKRGVTTGISAADRAQTIRTAMDPASTSDDIVIPGHVFPIKARPGGVLERVGHTEGSVDLARLAGKSPAAVICEIMNDDGTMARRPDLQTLAAKFEIPMVSIADLVAFRLSHDALIREVADRPFPTDFGVFRGKWFSNTLDDCHHFALIKGEPFAGKVVDVRVQRQQPVQDVFGPKNPLNSQDHARACIEYGLRMLSENDHAALVYLSAPSSIPESSDGPMDPRVYGIGAQILKKLGIASMRLHTTSEHSLIALRGFELNVVERCCIKQKVLGWSANANQMDNASVLGGPL